MTCRAERQCPRPSHRSQTQAEPQHDRAADGAETETQFSGKAGLGVAVTDAVGVYGEISFLTAEDDDDFGVGGKLGVKYNF